MIAPPNVTRLPEAVNEYVVPALHVAHRAREVRDGHVGPLVAADQDGY